MNNKEPIKLKLSTVIIIFIIFILIIGAIGFFVYSQNNRINTEKQETEIMENTIGEISIDDKEVQDAYKRILKYNNIFDTNSFQESFYKDTKVMYDNLTDAERMVSIVQYIKDKPTSTVEINSFINKSKKYDKTVLGENTTAKLYSKQLLEDNTNKIFGKDSNSISWVSRDNNCGHIYDYIDGQYYSYNYQGGGFGCPARAVSKLTKAERDNDSIYLYDEYIYIYDVPNQDSSITTYYYTSSSKTEQIGTEKNSNSEESDSSILTRYEGKAQNYKHTFKKDNEGNYYWYSSEPLLSKTDTSKVNNNTTIKNSTSSSSASKSVSRDDTISYEINKLSEGRVNVKATKNGKTISKDFEMDAMIDKTGTIKIENIGEVVLVSESGGEYCKTHIYQLVNDEIKKLGDIDCGADMVKDATYKVNKKGEGTAVIEANINGETIKKEFEMDAAIINTNVVDIFNYGKVVLVAETGGEYYGIKVYRLSQDYVTGKNKEIKNVGAIESKQ